MSRPPLGGGRRWGLRTLGFLALAAAAILGAGPLHGSGLTGLILLDLTGIAVGLTGAAVCTVRGLRGWRDQLRR
jgi:hypothetical protein